MHKNKFISIILIFTIAFSTLFSFSVSNATDTVTFEGQTMTKAEVVQRLKDLQTENPFEMAVSGIALGIGDFLLDYIVFLVKDEITIDRLVFNNILSLDANFFEANKKGLVPDTTEIICDVINEWYSFFNGLAIVAYMMILVFVGTKIMLGTPNAKAKGHDLIIKWTIGIAILFLFPYVMKYSFKLNEGIINEVEKTFTNNNNYSEIVGSYIGAVSDVQYDQVFEERSPEYISRSDYVYSVGTEEATFQYFTQLEKYKSRGDLMRIMRAMAGVTGKIIYVILWFIMLWQMIVLLFVYLKRYLMIAFLIMIFPIVIIEYIIGSVFSGKSRGFSAWCMEFFLNVFIQTIHAVAYGMIGGVVTAHVQNGIMSGNVARMNWVILIIAVNFIFEAESIIKKIIKANTKDSSVKNASEVSKGIRGMTGKIRSKIRLK